MAGMVWLVLLLIVVGLAISAPMCRWLIGIGARMGTFDSVGATGHAKALRRVPNIGGIAIFVAVVMPLAVGLALFAIVDEDIWARVLPPIVAHLERIRMTTPIAVAMIAGATLLHVIGLIDDRQALGPVVKLGVQTGVALIMAWAFDVRMLTALDGWLGVGPAPSIIVTVIWIVAITNAMNFLDNMDGLAAGVGTIAATFFMIACLINAQWFIAATLALLIGALIGFLIFNFPPAKLFMGDGGSLVIGFLLAILTVRTTYYDAEAANGALGGGWYAVFMPAIVLAIPLYDFLSVTAIRIRQGKSPFVGDQQHFSHRLVQRGLTQRGAVIVIWSATAVTGVGGISLGSLTGWQAVLVGVQTALVLLMLALLEGASRHAVQRSTAAESPADSPDGSEAAT